MVGPISKAGGVATHTLEIVSELKKLGHEVMFFNTMSRLGWRPGRKDPLTILDNIYKGFKNTFILLLYGLLMRSKYDVIHIQASGPIGGFIPAIVGARLKNMTGKHIVITFHHSKTEDFILEHKKIFGKVLSETDRFIVVSRRQKEFIIQQFGGKIGEKVVHIPNGYNPGRFGKIEKREARDHLSISQTDLVLVNVAWLMEKKGQTYLIKAMKSVLDSDPDVLCYIIGKGPLESELNAELFDLGLTERVILTGYLPLEEMVLYMNAADLFVLPSLDEGNPIVMFEALSLGLPYVGTDVGGIPEIITDDRYGYLVESKDVQGLASKILKARRRKWDHDIIRNYGEKFQWSIITRSTIDCYKVKRG